jgi:hypothetical protein
MDTVITSLLSSDLFLIETPTYTGSISAQQINYISTQFPKIYSVLGSSSINVLDLTSESLSVNHITPFTAKTATLTGNFNTFVLSSGLIISAYNTTSSEVSSISSTITRELSVLSAGVFDVFFESGTARLSQYIHVINSNGAEEITLSGNKAVPLGLTIGAQDIQIKVLFNGFTDVVTNTTYVTYNTSFPFVNLKDFDYNNANAQDGLPDDNGNNYVDAATRRIIVPISISNMPYAINNGIEGVLLTWKAQKFY